MKFIKQETKNKANERILKLLAELNSTLDLYYEISKESEITSSEQ